MKNLLLISLLGGLLLSGCHRASTKLVSTEPPVGLEAETPTNMPINTIAFGSCSDQKRDQPLWDDILAQNPQVWIWLGDNVYGDSEDMGVLKAKYDLQKSNPVYQQLRQSAAIIGVWDDHDYGVNDGGKEYPRRQESQQLMLDFLDVPTTSPLRTQAGGYSAHVYGPKGQQVKVILLDGRYFRDPLMKNGKDNVPNPTGDIMGETQWQWLEAQLTNSDADIHLIGSGIQVLPEEHPYEKWANFPVARQRLLDLLAKTKPRGAILLSGDRHMAEVSKVVVPGLGYDLYDITSSGLTHYSKPHEEPNKHRVGAMVANLNYGLITINWAKKPHRATVQIKGDSLATHLTQEIQF
ncbi:alkaline phosphatase D family protein [Fibrella aquatilis]|uniref:Alkaline phosphatase family protein n=1 Tax=Fibrella aquatilis TaxID=2817059 RepID=A0A939GDN7_9BACT|nr:alkaline phosphatase D family protein [Fibrella aquatilis]MBO0934488.1 alkaline phosphatase family protein [Fibrella aquatilis]